MEEDVEELNLEKRPETAFKFPQRGSMERRTMVRVMMMRMMANMMVLIMILIKVKEMLTAAVIPLLIFLVFSSCLGCILFTACGEVSFSYLGWCISCEIVYLVFGMVHLVFGISYLVFGSYYSKPVVLADHSQHPHKLVAA